LYNFNELIGLMDAMIGIHPFTLLNQDEITYIYIFRFFEVLE